MLHPLPFRTFGEIAALGYVVDLYCPTCHRRVSVDPAADHLRERTFAGTRFRCTGTRDVGFAHPRRPCEGTGILSVQPATLLPVGGEVTLVFLFHYCRPPGWEIAHMPLDRPPWSRAGWGEDDRWRCPICRRGTGWSIHEPDRKPSYYADTAAARA